MKTYIPSNLKMRVVERLQHLEEDNISCVFNQGYCDLNN